jgi:hypothetical protein
MSDLVERINVAGERSGGANQCGRSGPHPWDGAPVSDLVERIIVAGRGRIRGMGRR